MTPPGASGPARADDDGWVPPTREEWERVQAALKRNNRENKILRFLKAQLVDRGIDPDTFDGLALAHKRAEELLATTEQTYAAVLADRGNSQLVRESVAELVEVRRRELQDLDRMMRGSPASSVHRGKRAGPRPIPKAANLI